MIVDKVKLEVAADAPAGQLTNLAVNPNGDQGGYGWITTVVGSKIGTIYGTSTHQLQYAAAGGVANSFRTANGPVVPGAYVAAGFTVGYISGYYRASIAFFDSNLAQVGGAVSTSSTLTSSASRVYLAPAAVPAGAVFASLVFNFYRDTALNVPNNGAKMNLKDVTLVTGSTAAAVTKPAFTEATYWLDVTDSLTGVDWNRPEMDLGILTSTLVDNDLDPGASTTLRSGRAVKLSALTGFVTSPLLATDPTMSVGGWTRLTYGGGSKPVMTTSTAFSPDQRCAPRSKVTSNVSLNNPTSLTVNANVYPLATINGYVGLENHAGVPTKVVLLPGQSKTISGSLVLGGGDTGFVTWVTGTAGVEITSHSAYADEPQWDRLFTGVMQRPTVKYDPVRKMNNAPKYASITFNAVDAQSRLASSKKTQGTYDLEYIPAVMEYSGVPWNVEGSAAQVASIPTNRSFTAPTDTSVQNHLIRIRNSYYSLTSSAFKASLWVDRYGVLQAWRTTALTDGYRGLLNDPTFSTGVGEWESVSNSTISFVSGDATYGTAMKVTAPAAGNVGWQSTATPVAPGATYSFSYYLRPTVASRRIASYVSFNLSGGGTTNYVLSDSTAYPTTAYGGYVNKRALAPADAVSVSLWHILVGANASEVIYESVGRINRVVDVTLGADDVSDSDAGYDDSDFFNSVTIDSLQNNTSGVGYQETHGPYTSASSIAVYDVQEATVEVCGWSSDNSNLTAYVNYILNRNSVPKQHVTSVTIPIRTQTEINRHAFRDVFDVVNLTTPIVDTARVASVQHSIKSNKDGGTWTCTLGLVDPERLVA